MSKALLDHAIGELRKAGDLPSVLCKICGGETEPFDMLDFNKSCNQRNPMGFAAIPVIYRLCGHCRFIFTAFFDDFTGDQWRRYVYNEDYAKVDPEYLDGRPRLAADQLSAFLVGRKSSTIGLDYGGGNGKTTALMRKWGWTFDCYDPFGKTDMSPERKGRYNFCCAIEVFEHMTDPVGSLRAIVEMANPGPLTIMIGTGVHDGIVSEETGLAWWYAAPRNGHVSLYSREALRILGAKFGLTYAGILSGPHLLLRDVGEQESRARLLRGKLLRRFRSALKTTSVS